MNVPVSEGDETPSQVQDTASPEAVGLPWLLAQAQTDDALAALMADQNPASAASQRGVQLYQARDYAQACPYFEAAAALAPDQPVHSVNHGVALMALGDGAGAIRLFHRALSADRKLPEAWLNMAHALQGLDRLDEAEAAFLEAGKDAASAREAFTALGTLRMGRLRYSGAAEAFGHAIAAGEPSARSLAQRGAALFQAGDALSAHEAYAAACALDPEEPGFRQNLEFLTMLRGVLEGKADPAIAAFARPLTDDALLVSALSRSLNFLLAFDKPREAAALVREWLQYYDSDPTASYFQDVLDNKRITRAPAGFISAHFDEVAAQFTDTFAAQMQYAVPATLARMLAENAAEGEGPPPSSLLDLGCGTGLMGLALQPQSGHLAGVDLSARMVERAIERDIYDELVVADCVEFMARHPETFDAIVAADSLLYFGELSILFQRAAEALRGNGWFACSVETTGEGSSYILGSNGRFRHHPDYVGAVARANGLRPMERRDIVLRQEFGQSVPGSVFLFQRA